MYGESEVNSYSNNTNRLHGHHMVGVAKKRFGHSTKIFQGGINGELFQSELFRRAIFMQIR